MCSKNNPNVQSILRIIEVYIEAEIDELERKLENIKKINTAQISEDICLNIEITNDSEEREVIYSLMELINA